MTTRKKSEGDGLANVWDTESQCIGMLVAGCNDMSEKAMLSTLRKIRTLVSTRRCPKIVELEGIWSGGGSVRFRGNCCSTGVAQMQIEARANYEKLWLVRVYHDGLLVREFDVLENCYTLALD